MCIGHDNIFQKTRKAISELYYTNNKLILKSNIYFDLNPCQFDDIMIKSTKLY